MVLRCDKPFLEWHSDRRNTQKLFCKQYKYSIVHGHLVGKLYIYIYIYIYIHTHNCSALLCHTRSIL